MVLTVIVVGLGQMGRSHALAYHSNPGFSIIALVNRSSVSLPDELQHYRTLTDFEHALELGPDVVSVSTHADSHAKYAISAMEAGAHVFLEKPIAPTVEEAETVVQAAKRTNRKLLVGYILRYHPTWIHFISQARLLGPPYVMRMNLNQQSTGDAWSIHKELLRHTSPVVDCGVHYIDVMLQITESHPKQVRGMGIRLSDEISEGQINYGHLQVTFADGSIGWYEAGWGPMISETSHFVKDVMSPRGSVSLVGDETVSSADVDSHTKVAHIHVHRTDTGYDQILPTVEAPSHQDLCNSEQQALLNAIEKDHDLSKHWEDAVRSLEVVLAADRSMRENRAIDL
ncbi:quinate utilization oxidoreductase QutH [Polychaeton citri CBS 116435]|uniref:Quinate utilization oxidoreductase QutH n=1 Tax=Polychaeton citri CBS 116435 TaxID=1314669 RepID=A0A9P4Q5J1_9PEZI|nr:quinate utilization oxidoreductase QutH [Polychaeton citri CBS 116435]